MKLVELSQGKRAIVDDSDFESVEQYHWWARKDYNTYYVFGWVNGKTVSLHRFIVGAKKGEEVDHKNRNGLDNRKFNLRICTHSQNCQNRGSKNGGVYHDLVGRRWRASIFTEGKRVNLGSFRDKNLALETYKEAKKILHPSWMMI